MRRYIIALVIVVGIFAAWAAVSAADSVSANNKDSKLATPSGENTIQATSPMDFPWTTVGSAGTVDESDLSIYRVNGPNIDIISSKLTPIPTAYLDVRYNVVAEAALFYSSIPEMRVGYRDNGNNASVYLYLKEVNLTTGVERTVLTFNSNNFLASNSIQTQRVFNCSNIGMFNFRKNAYYIDAKIYKTGIGGAPLLNTIQVSTTLC